MGPSVPSASEAPTVTLSVKRADNAAINGSLMVSGTMTRRIAVHFNGFSGHLHEHGFDEGIKFFGAFCSVGPSCGVERVCFGGEAHPPLSTDS